MERRSFVHECIEDENRFSKPIKKTKILLSVIFRRKTNHKRYRKLQAFETQDIFLVGFYSWL